jgi:GTP-binding nuclear protein Ran
MQEIHRLPQSRFKVILVGDGGTGKSTFIERHLTGNFRTYYIATIGADIHALLFHTSYGPIVFDIWDIAGNPADPADLDLYYSGAHAAIIFFDLTSRESYKNVTGWRSVVKRACPDIPIIVCGNKADMVGRVVAPIDIHVPLKEKYYDISAKSNYNYEKPFLQIARTLTGHNDLFFVATPDERYADADSSTSSTKSTKSTKSTSSPNMESSANSIVDYGDEILNSVLELQF